MYGLRFDLSMEVLSLSKNPEMTAKPVVPPKPKTLVEKEKKLTLVAHSSRISAVTPVPVISSPFETSTKPEPQFFYGPLLAGRFRSFCKEGEESFHIPSSFGPAAGRRSSGSASDSSVNSTFGKKNQSIRSRFNIQNPFPCESATEFKKSLDVGLECRNAFAEAKRKFDGHASGDDHASSNSTTSYQSIHAANLSSHDKQKISTNGSSSPTMQSSSSDLENFGQLRDLSLSENRLTANQMLDRFEHIEPHSGHGENMGITDDSAVTSRNSVISNGTISSTDSEKSVCFTSEEHLPMIPKAHKVATEIVESEYQYLQSLKLLLVDFPVAVQGSIPPEEVTMLLRGLPQIEQLCQDLQGDLRLHLEAYEVDRLIAPVFLKKGKVLLLYVSYVNDFEKLIDTYRSLLKKYPNFAEAVGKFEASPICKKLPLVEYFHKPIQRLPRYPLLLGTYLRALEEDHPDRDNAKLALDLVSDVTAQANTTLASLDKVHKLLWYQARTVGYTFLRANRTYIREGILKKLSRKAPQDRTVLLCSDAIICGEFDPITGMKFTVNQEYPLIDIQVEHFIDSNYFDRELEFGISSTKKSFVFQAHSIEERNAWISAISRATEELQKKNSRKLELRTKSLEKPSFAPIWIPDYRVSACQLCKKQFGLFRRYHHCRLCGYAVCSGCSPHEIGIDYKDNRSKRVCMACFQDPSKAPDSRR